MRAFLAALIVCLFAASAHAQRASWYDEGRMTASGERFAPDGLTAAMWGVPFGTLVAVCRDVCVVVRINDRGPAKRTGRDIDLSRGAARALHMLGAGVAHVSLRIIGGVHAASYSRPRVRLHRHHRVRAAQR
jgi:rare lipoprotein A